MSRVTAPVSKLARAIGTTSASRASPLLDSTSHVHNAGAVLMPKYAELLLNRSSEHSDSSRGLTTQHRPTPQPSITNRSKPLMQTFATNSPAPRVPSSHLDATVIPSMAEAVMPEGIPRVPLVPDNYAVNYGQDTTDSSSIIMPTISIVAANPENVLPGTPLSEVAGPGLDGVDLAFVHQRPAPAPSNEGGLISDIWRGMVDDILGPKKAL